MLASEIEIYTGEDGLAPYKINFVDGNPVVVDLFVKHGFIMVVGKKEPKYDIKGNEIPGTVRTSGNFLLQEFLSRTGALRDGTTVTPVF